MTRNIELSAEQGVAHFRDHGWLRIPQAFDAGAASAMRDVVWEALGRIGIDRDRPSTWTVERPAHLQQLKTNPVFRAVGSPRLRSVIDAIFEGRPHEMPKDWGACFPAFPSRMAWGIPASGWHIDARYTAALWPTGGVKTHALLGDVLPRGGGTLIVSGSHRLIHRWFAQNPPPAGAPNAILRKMLQAHPYIRALFDAGDGKPRVTRFMDRVETVDGIPLQVVENRGAAGDVILLHPLMLHVAAPNNTARPRFLLSGGITTDMWGWAS